MTILAVDNDENELKKLKSYLKNKYSQEEIVAIAHPMLATKYGLNNQIDMVYVKVNMIRFDGYDVRRVLLQHKPQTQIIMIMGDEDFLQ